jgi:hypothetical protein
MTGPIPPSWEIPRNPKHKRKTNMILDFISII